MENEIWLPIVKPVDFTGKFEISSEGRLKRLGYYNKIDKIWKPDLIRKISKSGKYLRIMLHKDRKSYNLSIHRIVCWAFHEKPEGKDQVNHKNGIKYDNRAVNVEWCNQSENIRHAQSIGLMKYAKQKPPKRKRGRAKGCEGIFKSVIDINTSIIYKSTQEVSSLFKIPFRTLRRALAGERYNKTPFRYIVNGEIKNDVMLPPVKPPKPEKVKFIRPPKKEYVPHPKETKKVAMYDLQGNVITVFNSAKLAAEHIKTTKDTFRKAIKISPTGYHKGFIFKYA